MSILEVNELRDRDEETLVYDFHYREGSWGEGGAGTIQRHKDTCKNITGRRRTLSGGHTVVGSTWGAGEGNTPAPSPLPVDLLHGLP